jgi:hypothetical protein
MLPRAVRPPLERRAWLRAACNLSAGYLPAERTKVVPFCMAAVANLSCTGARLVARHRFEPGDLLAVTLLDQSQTYRCQRQARVAHSEQQPDGRWALGCEFSEELTEEEVERLLG